MKYFFDTEFIEEQNYLELISIGMVSEDNRKYYAISSEFNVDKTFKQDWLVENVLTSIFNEMLTLYINEYDKKDINIITPENFKYLLNLYGKPIVKIKEELLQFIDKTPEFYAYYCSYDWVLFSWIFGRMVESPEYFPMYCNDIKLLLNNIGIDSKLKEKLFPDPENIHNALEDALWNKNVYDNLKNINKIIIDKKDIEQILPKDNIPKIYNNYIIYKNNKGDELFINCKINACDIYVVSDNTKKNFNNINYSDLINYINIFFE